MIRVIWSLFLGVMMLFTSVSANPKAMIIFDASGSMWGQIDGVNKIVIARDALKSVVSRWNPKVELGLTAYGHRVKGDCNDIETVIPIGKVNKKQMIDKVMSIMPKGMTPIAKSLRQVANDLRQYEDQTTIILISDGRESCDADPCATARELKAEGINFVTHVVGFNVDLKTDRQLACIAKATGGEYFSAKNAASLTKAIKTIAKKVEKSKPKPRAVSKTTVELIARYSMSNRDISGMQWQVTQDGKSLYKGDMQSPKVTAKVGKVHIKALYNRTSKEQLIEGDIALKSTKSNPIIIKLKSAKVTIDASEEEGGPRVEASVYIYPIIDGNLNSSDKIDSCTPTKSKKCEIVLPIGEFLVKANYNSMSTEQKIELTNKEEKKLHLYFKQTGSIQTTASETEGGKWIEAYHIVYMDDEGKLGESICSPYSHKNREGKCRLPVGKYLVKSEYNEFRKLTPIEIKAGETLKLHVLFGSTGNIQTTASEIEGGKWIEAYHVVYKDDDGKLGEHICSPYSHKKREGKCKLPVGKYLVKSEYNEFKKLTPIEIKAGETLKFHVVFGSTGNIQTSASETEGGKWIEAYHVVYRDDDGKLGEHICSPSSHKTREGKCRLPVGKYLVKSSSNNFEKITPIEIKAGETLKFHVLFTPYTIHAKCTKMNDIVTYEIYASSGRMVSEKRLACSKAYKMTLDSGDYSVEAHTANATAKAKFTLKPNSSNELTLTLEDQEHKAEIEADKSTIEPKPKKIQNELEQTATAIVKQATDAVDKHEEDIKKVGELFNALGGLMGGQNKTNSSTPASSEEMNVSDSDLELFSK